MIPAKVPFPTPGAPIKTNKPLAHEEEEEETAVARRWREEEEAMMM